MDRNRELVPGITQRVGVEREIVSNWILTSCHHLKMGEKENKINKSSER